MIADRHSRALYRALIQRARLSVLSTAALLLLIALVAAQRYPLPNGYRESKGSFIGVSYAAAPNSRSEPLTPLLREPEVNIDPPEAAPAETSPLTEPLPELACENADFSLLELPEDIAPPARHDSARQPILAARETTRTPPSYRSAPKPPYPAALQQRRIEGKLRVRIEISAEGYPTAVSITESSGHSEFDHCTRDWIQAHWRFTPATENGHAIASVVTTAVKFEL